MSSPEYRRAWRAIAVWVALCIATVAFFATDHPVLGSASLLATVALALYVKYAWLWPD